MFFFLLGVHVLVAEEPWGKDADMVIRAAPKKLTKSGAGFETIIRFHQQVISEADGPRSHFKPSSSQYVLNAIHKRGLGTGLLMGADRLLRENSERWIYPLHTTKSGHTLKSDPVP
ncbi:MAG TPA: membrane protein insertion efficiency factor YidD [Chlamydiales bacterium]|nr:membrane protein insertion efficiency factor YidD [Chlamydiales bacterium]